MPVIMGTAGHIDHGKTTLVKALTGIDCDRLVEEKKRGITIELGFAFYDLPQGERLGIVDMPGHERFVKNMVAGAAGIDFVLLVVAADEGVMPQTREHLEICTLLGVDQGLVALTKADMVDEELLELAREDVSDFLGGTFLEDAPVIPVSAHTGQGLADVASAIASLVDSLPVRRRTDLFRLPIDRVFTMRGHGTVVTGTMVSGSVSLGEAVTLYPSGTATKVRGLQSHGEQVETAPAGRRTAVNLHGLEVEDVARGEVLARPGSLFPSKVWDVELTYLSSAHRDLKHRKEVHFHHGTREQMAKVYLLDRDALAPGDTARCQVRFAEPMAGVWGDRVVVRSFSPLRTIAGGRLINPMGRKLKRMTADTARLLADLAEGDADARVLAQLWLAGPVGLSFAELLALTGEETKTLDKLIQTLSSQGKALLYDKEQRRYVSGELAEGLMDSAAAHLKAFHEAEPMRPGLTRGELASAWGKRLPDKLLHMLIERMCKQGVMEAEAEVLRLAGHEVSLATDQEALRDGLLKAYRDGGATPPNLKDVLADLGIGQKAAAPVLKLLQEQGELVKIGLDKAGLDMFYATRAMERIKDRVAGFLTDNAEMSAPQFKDLTGLSRKYAIPVMEYLDKEKFTVRVGDVRVLRKR